MVSIVGVAAPAFACSVTSQQFYSADLSISSFVGSRDANGHTLGTFTFTFCNNGSTTIPAGTSYTVTLTALKAPGGGDKNIVIGVGPQVGLTVSPATSVSLNPDGPTSTRSHVVTTTLPMLPGTCRSAVFTVDTATGIGATRLQMATVLRDFGTNPCNVAAPGNQSTLTAEWGQNAS